MADSMCGPSNALNTFQKYTSVDRTLQQDRLIQRQSPSQGFRSSPGPQAGLINPEFEAFQAGHPPLEQHSLSPPPVFGHAPQPFQQAGPASWASDFQRMNISGPAPQVHQGYTPQQNAVGAGWNQEFAQNQGAGVAQRNVRTLAQGMGMGMNSGYRYSPMASQMNMGGQMGGFAGPMSQSSTQQAQSEAFDEAAFEKAFEEAAQYEAAQVKGAQNEAIPEELLQQEAFQNGLAQQTASLSQPQEIAQPAENLMEAESDNLNLPRIGADTIPHHQKPSPQQEKSAPDDMARAAGHILKIVSNDQSAKFKGSQFLELMRLIQAKEVVVQGDDFVGTGTGSADIEIDAEKAVGKVKVARPSDYLDMWSPAAPPLG